MLWSYKEVHNLLIGEIKYPFRNLKDMIVGVYMVRVGLGWEIFLTQPKKFGLVGLVTQPNPKFFTTQSNPLFSSQLEGFAPWTRNQFDLVQVHEIEPNPTRNANPTQPNPYSFGWVGPVCRVECTPPD